MLFISFALCLDELTYCVYDIFGILFDTAAELDELKSSSLIVSPKLTADGLNVWEGRLTCLYSPSIHLLSELSVLVLLAFKSLRFNSCLVEGSEEE
jgi:hypothetical protein